jgi:hypothetical protein
VATRSGSSITAACSTGTGTGTTVSTCPVGAAPSAEAVSVQVEIEVMVTSSGPCASIGTWSSAGRFTVRVVRWCSGGADRFVDGVAAGSGGLELGRVRERFTNPPAHRLARARLTGPQGPLPVGDVVSGADVMAPER